MSQTTNSLKVEKTKSNLIQCSHYLHIWLRSKRLLLIHNFHLPKSQPSISSIQSPTSPFRAPCVLSPMCTPHNIACSHFSFHRPYSLLITTQSNEKQSPSSKFSCTSNDESISFSVFPAIFNAFLRKFGWSSEEVRCSGFVFVTGEEGMDVLSVGCCSMVMVVHGEIAKKRKKEFVEMSFLIKINK